MTFWKRAASLQIGASQYSLDTLNFSFEAVFEDQVKLSTAKATVYNLSESKRNSIKQGQPLIINAGYEGDKGLVFVGEISGIEHKRQNVDWVTELKATAALDAWLSSEINKTYKQGINAKDVISDLLNIFGIEVGTFELAANKTYPRGRVCCGKLKDVLEELTVRDCQSRLLIKNGQVIINDPAKGVRSGYLISKDTGLLRSSADKEETPSGTSETQEMPKRICECLLNYHLGIAEEVKICSEKLNGNFLIVRCTHKGDRAGDWKTILEVKPV